MKNKIQHALVLAVAVGLLGTAALAASSQTVGHSLGHSQTHQQDGGTTGGNPGGQGGTTGGNPGLHS